MKKKRKINVQKVSEVLLWLKFVKSYGIISKLYFQTKKIG